MIRTAERMGGAVYTEDLVAKQVNTKCLSLYISVYSCQAWMYIKCYIMVAKQERKEKIYEMMRQGDWRAVCKEFHVRQFTKLLDLKLAKILKEQNLISRRRTSTENHCLSGFDPPRSGTLFVKISFKQLASMIFNIQYSKKVASF